LLGKLVYQVEYLVETVNQIEDKLDRVGESSRRSENELIMWIETIREEIEIEKRKEKKDKGKKR